MDSRPPQDSLNPAALELLRFRQRLFAATPRLWVTYALVALNCGVWMVQVVAGVDAASPGAEVLVRWGGNLGTAVHAGEYWRLLSATVLHGGAIHLAFNMFALWIIGQTVERVLGNAGFAATYLISGLAGSVASVIASPDVVSVGASGAVFGILGAQLTALLSRRVGLPAALRPGIMRNGVLIIGVNLAFGFSIPNIDNAAHMGGLIAGAMAGAALAHSLDSEGIARRGRRAALATLGGIGILAATLALVPNSAGADRARMPSGRRELDDVHSVYLELVRGLNEQESVRRATGRPLGG